MQKYLFEVIKSQVPEQYRLVDIIEELLNVGQDSAYRRLRGEKELTLSEAHKLCQYFHLSMDEILLNKNSGQGALCQYTAVNMADRLSYIKYIERLSKMLAGLKSTEDSELFFTAQDIPFYHFLNYTELLFFKLYVWNDIVNRKKVSFRSFCDQLDKNTIVPIYKQMYHDYMQIPSKEIWTNQTVDTVLRLLDFYVETGAFESKETVFRLLNLLSDLLDTVNVCARNGFKDDKKQIPFSMYVCSVDLENNFMLARRGNQWSCSIKLYTVNSLTTSHADLCNETQKWIDDLIQKSILISGGTSERECFRFFQTSKNKIKELIDKVEKAEWM